MKAKHLFVSLVLPTVLAACTADDFVAEQGNVNLPERPVVGNIDFILSDAATRVAVDGNKIVWSKDDKLGAALMDEYSPSKNVGSSMNPNLVYDAANPESNYTIVDNLYTNYLYDYDATNNRFYNNNAVFVEGNYFVYLPFNENQAREGLAYSISANQTTGEDGFQALIDNQFFLDHIFVKQGNSQVEVDPIAAFARVNMKLAYDGSQNVEIRKIVIKNNAGFGLQGKVKPATALGSDYDALAGLTVANRAATFDPNDYKVAVAGSNMAKVFNAYKKAVADLEAGKFTIGKDEKIVNPNVANFFVADSEKTGIMTLNYTAFSDDVFGLMIAPIGEKLTENDVTFEIYTNKGLVTISGATQAMSKDFDFSTDKSYPETAPATEATLLDKAMDAVSFSGISKYVGGLKADQYQEIAVNFKDDAILVPPTLTVSSTNELEYYLENWYSGKKGQIAPNSTDVVTVNAVPEDGESIEITTKVLSFIKNTAANPTIKFEGDIVIPADADPTTINYIKKGSADLNVTNYATQNWTATAEFTTLTNEGTLTIGTGAADEMATYTVTTINNNNSLTVNKAIGTGLTDYVNNFGTLVANANINANVINGTVGVDGNHTAKMTLNTGSVTILTNYAEFEVPAGKNVTVQKIENYYNAVISGTLRTATVSKSLNAAGATITLNEGAKWNVADSQSGFENNGTVTNKGTITVAGKFANKGTVNNYKQIACSDGASFNNEKLMNVYANSITLISKNSDAGAEIIVEQGVTTINVAGEDKGKITFVVSSKEGLKSIPTIANSLRITAAEIDLSELNNEKITFVEFKPAGNMSITCKSDDEVNSFEVVTFTADSAEKQFNLNGNLTATENLTIGTNATVVINDKLTFASAGADFVNNGSMLIIGTLNFSAIAVGDKGTVKLGNYLFAGGSASTNITWKSDAGDGAGTIG